LGLSAAKEAEDVQRAKRVWLGLSAAKEAEALSRDNAEGVVANTKHFDTFGVDIKF
jgi:hypothetical protein